MTTHTHTHRRGKSIEDAQYLDLYMTARVLRVDHLKRL